MSTADMAADLERAASLRPLLLAGAVLSVAFFGGLGGWAATAPLAGAVAAPAVVVPGGHRRVVQHAEGGTVREILVRDGDKVAAGQPLLLLDDTRVRAEVRALEAQWYTARTGLARLQAEGRDEATIAWDADLTAAADRDPVLAGAMRAEGEQLAARRAALESQVAVLEHRQSTERGTIEGLTAQVESLTSQITLIDADLGDVEPLVAKGLEPKPRLLTVKLQRSQLDGSLAAALAEIEGARQAIAAADLDIASLRRQRAAEIARDLAAAQATATELGEKLRSARDRLERTVVRAPVAGTVLNLNVRTGGGVIGAGEALLELVPADDPLVLEARIQPNDIHEVAPGRQAQIYLTAYKVRRLPRLTGTVDYVSADRLTDPASQQPYYTARIVAAREEVARLGKGVVLTPGMPAEALIVTRERTMLDYLLAPLTELFRSGMRES